MKILKAVVFTLALLPGLAYGVEFRRAQATLDDVFSASCRVNVANARGSGSFIGVFNDEAYVLTNYHVVENNKTATCDFWTNGVRQNIAGKVVWRAYDASMPADFALIALNAEELKEKINPPYIALAGRDGKPTVNSFFISAGGPKGWSVKAWKGKTLSYDGNTARFQPHPVPGQSGSGVFEEIDGECWLVGVVTWLIGTENDDNSSGGAIPVANLYRAVDKKPVVSPGESERSAIPEGAIECVEQPNDFAEFNADGAQYLETAYQPVKIVVFVRNNCPACESIKPDLLQLHAANFPIYRCDFGDPLAPGEEPNKNQKLALAYGVTEFPTVIILQNDSTPLVRIDYATLTEQGAYKAISEAFSAVTVDSAIDTPEPLDNALIEEPSARNDETQTTPSDCDDNSCPVIIDGTESMLLAPYGETGRERVYSNETDVGLIEDSESRWRARGNKPAQPQGELPRLGEQEEPGKGLDAQDMNTFSDRIVARITSAMARQFQMSADNISGQLQQKLSDALAGDVSGIINNLEAGIQQKIESSAKGLIRRYIWKIGFALFCAVLLAQLALAVIKRAGKELFARLVALWQEVKDLKELHEATKG